MQWKTIGTIGLNAEEIDFIEENVPQQQCDVMDTDVVTDIIATGEFAVIIKAAGVTEEDMNMLFEYYSEIAPFSETVIVIGNINVPEVLKQQVLVYDNFETLQDNLKYVLLSAFRKQKKFDEG